MITSLTLIRAAGGYRLSYASDLVTPTFTIYRDGALVATTTETSWPADVPGTWEVFDDATSPAFAYPDFAILTWYAVATAVAYGIDEKQGASWVARETIDDDTSPQYFLWRSDRLADDTTHEFRIVPIDAAGNEGTPISRTLLMVRVPDAPEVTFAYSSVTTKVTVSAA